MAEVEDVARPAAGPPEDVLHLAVALGGGREQRGRVEVALDRAGLAAAAPRLIERNAPVDADDIPTGAGEILQEGRRARAEVNDRNAPFGGERQRLPAVGQDEAAVVLRRQAAHPAVEQLQRLRARARLRGEIAADQLGEFAEQQVPGVGGLVHQRFGPGEGPRGSALDRVAGERERRSGEPDQRGVGGERGAREAHRLEHRTEVRFRVDGGKLLDVRLPAHRLGDVRALARREAQPQPQRLEGKQDVGEQDRRIHAEALDRLERHLSGQLGSVTEIEDGVLLAQLAVLWHVASGLPHEPHRRDVGAFPAAGLKKAQLREPRRER